MRRGVRKTKQVIAGILSAVLFMTSLPQNSTYVYATEQAEELITNETMQIQNETEEITDGQTELTVDEETQVQTEAETSKTEKSEKEETEEAEEKSTLEKTKEEIIERETSIEVNEKESTESATERQEEITKLEETMESEQESEIETSNIECENKTDLQERTVEAELLGVYQFGGSPAENNRVSAYSINSVANTNIAELEEYLYQQMKARKEKIDVASYQINTEMMGKIVSGVLNENPDLYFVNRGFSCTHYAGDTLTLSVLLTYDNTLNDAAFQKATKEALAVVESGMSDLEKAVVLHDYLAVNCEYDEENLEAGTIPDTSYSAYGVLVNRIAVCEGYALAYKYLLNKAGINCYMVNSDTMNHAWNLIELDGKYYQVDVTWDDPVLDLIGRVRHEFMFRSDDAFINECRHKDWSVTKGSEVVNYKAVDTTYDTAFWLDCNSPLVLVGKDCYYVIYDEEKKVGVINKTKLSDSTGTGETICEIGKWLVWKESGWWQNAYSGLFWANDRLYYNDIDTINSIILNEMDNSIQIQEEFAADTTNGYIYGSALCQGKVLYSLHQSPNLASKETVLEADITIEIEPSEIAIEKIELDKESLSLTVGSTANLQAVITPSEAADAEITWKSSDISVATVENGTVTAVAAGNCNITVSAGGKEAVCNVTVSESLDNNIASGSYQDITWVIDVNGKLAVTGTGDFAALGTDDTNNDRAPWHGYANSILSAEINVSGMEDASYMFHGLANLKEVDLSGFDTANITNMHSMFSECSNLISIDVNGFRTGNVTKMGAMFKGCSSLTSVDVSSFDSKNVINMEGMFADCPKLSLINTPYNVTQSVLLPTADATDIWYQPDGTVITELPQNLPYSIIITKNTVPAVSDPYITVTKTKTTYNCGDSLNIDDLTVTYYNKNEDPKIVTDFTTNANEIDMSVSGIKTLMVTYNELTASIKITVLSQNDPNPDQQTYTVTFNLQGHGTVLDEYTTYTEIPKGSTITSPTAPQAEGFQFTGWYKEPDCKTLWDFAKDTIESDTTLYAGWNQTNTPDDDNPAQDIPDGIWIAKIKDYTYTGKAIIPSVSVYYNKKKLTAGQDYTITYKNNTKAASADDSKAPTVIVKGKGDYSGSKKATFNITKIQLTEQENIKAAKIYPIGIKYSPIVTANGNILKSGTDYKLIYKDATGTTLKKQPTKAGDYQLNITGKGNCEGEIIFSYAVSESGGANAISKGTATIANYIYGSEEPEVTLSVDGKTLTRDTDYLVSFANTYKKGTATATFIGIGNYTGTIKKNFKVQASAIQPNNIVVAKTASYEKGGAKAEVSVTVNGTELVLGTDYTATYKKNTKLGTASVVIKGKGNYTGSQTKEFKVEPKSLTADGVKIYVSDVLTGKKPAITLYDTNGKKLAANSDYKAEIDKAAHQVTISAGKNGLYKTETPITISYQELERGKQVTSVALNKKSNTLPKYFEYTGKEVVLEKEWLTVKAGKNILKSDEFEILGYVNNTKKGTATVIIKGCNGYGGIKMLNFKIKARGLF